MTKVVYTTSPVKTKRYIVQFRSIDFPRDGWGTYSGSFRFKWAAILSARISQSNNYEQRVVDTRD